MFSAEQFFLVRRGDLWSHAVGKLPYEKQPFGVFFVWSECTHNVVHVVVALVLAYEVGCGRKGALCEYLTGEG